jgi:hypothetical protein
VGARGFIIAFAMLSTMNLDYLVFDHSEDTEGVHTFEAMASVGPAHWPAVQLEVAQVLQWAHRRFAGERGAIDDGADWDYELQGLHEVASVEALSFDEATGQLRTHLGPAGQPRHTATLTLTGREHFAQTFSEAFGLSD